MSQGNVELARDAAEAFNRGDISPWLAICDPNADWFPLLTGVEGGTFIGPAGVAEWVEELTGAFEDVHVEVEEVLDLGDLVLITGVFSGRGRASGAPFARPTFQMLRFSEGKIVWSRVFETREEALQAVGLEE